MKLKAGINCYKCKCKLIKANYIEIHTSDNCETKRVFVCSYKCLSIYLSEMSKFYLNVWEKLLNA